jgi:hypothetical protein
MRAAPIGDNTYLLASKGQRGAKDDAHGRSVELIHQVLNRWLCARPQVAARVTAPSGNRYTAASAAVVREFQAEVGVLVDGLVGVVTLAEFDSMVASGRQDPQPPDVCGAREPGEAETSALEPLELVEEPWSTDKRHERSLFLDHFTVGDATLAKGSAATLDRLAELLDPKKAQRHEALTALDCWKPAGATVVGYADCLEDRLLGTRRAELIRDRFPGLPIRVESPPSPLTNTQTTPEDRRTNRSVYVTLELASAGCAPTGGCSPAQLNVIREAAKKAEPWLHTAVAQLNAFVAQPQAPATAAALDAMRRHFAFGQSKDIARMQRHARQVSERLTDISEQMASPSFAIECHDRTDPGCASMPAYVRDQKMLVLCPSYFNFKGDYVKDPLDRAQDVIHELAHTLTAGGPLIVDRAYRNERYYRIMTPDEALTNAESYAALARELGTSTEVPIDSPTDTFEDCPPAWEKAIDRALAIAARWNRDARVMTSVIVPELIGRNRPDPMLNAWTALRNQHLSWTNTPLDDAKRVYESAATELKQRFTDRKDQSDTPKIECDAGARGRRADREWYVYVPNWYSRVLHIGPRWLQLPPDEERPQSLLAGLYCYWNLVAAKGKKRRASHMTRAGREKEAQNAAQLAALARELSALRR